MHSRRSPAGNRKRERIFVNKTKTMIKTTALIIESSDYTKDGNLKGDVFRAVCAASVVIDGNSVVKNSPQPETKPQPPVVINNCSDDA